MRWIGWQRKRPPNPWGDGSLDSALEKVLTVHAVTAPNVGGYRDKGNGLPGRALCGVAVPADNPDTIVRWERTGRECRKCLVALKGEKGAP